MLQQQRRRFCSHWVRPESFDYFKNIVESRVYEAAIQTPLGYARSLSEELPGNNTVLLKREDLQPTFSFNLRGAYNKLANLSHHQKKNGVIAVSAGNHAQGVALSASKFNLDALIVVPEGTAMNKIDQVKKYGASVIEHGKDFEQAMVHAFYLARTQGRAMIHPFDDPFVIAGQGTIAMEIIKQTAGKQLDVIFAPVGGGGLVSGLAAFVQQVAPDVKIIGVEVEGANPMQQSLEINSRVTLPTVNLFADEAASSCVGREPFRICQTALDDVITVSTDQVCAAIKDTFGDTRALMEPLGALSVAGLKKYCREMKCENQTLVAILAAANMDFDRLRFVSERSDDRERFMTVTLPEKPGSYQKLYDMIYPPRNVTEFSYRMHSEHDTEAHICMSIQTENFKDFQTVLSNINATDGMKALDLTTNEMAKAHLRHLVGGRPLNVKHERLFRIEFPERPGALKEFLYALGPSGSEWNVSLFHYRNHGADIGRVLVGFQVEARQHDKFMTFLNQLGFSYVEETENPIYKQFLL